MVSKRIMMIGVLDVNGSTNIAMADAFRRLGHSVEEYNYRTRIQKLGSVIEMNRDYSNLINGRKFDLQVFCKTNQMVPDMLDWSKVSGPTWYWFMDNMEMCKSIHASAYAQNASFCSATASDVADRFMSLNKNAHHIFEGYDPLIYQYECVPKIYDYLFIGHATYPRIEALQKLRNEGKRVTIFGSGWPIGMEANSPVFGEDEAVEMNSANVVLNLCHDDVIFSDRVIKALACGANVMSHNCKDLRNLAQWLVEEPAQQKYILESEAEWIHIVNDRLNMFRNHAPGLVIHPSVHETHIRHHHSWDAVCSGMLEKVRVHETAIR